METARGEASSSHTADRRQSTWDRLKATGLPALFVLLPSAVWLALSTAVLQACLLPLFYGGRRKEYYLASRLLFSLVHRPLVYFFEYSGSQVFFHGPGSMDAVFSHLGSDQGIILSNHRGYLDWLVGLFVLDVGGGLGCCKAIVKRSLLSVPFMGFIWWAVDFVSVKRSWASDSATLQDAYKNQHAYRDCKVPYALTIFPEGTRMGPTKLKESQAFARSRGLTVLRHVLCPRTKGVWSAVNGLRLDSVFDVTLAMSPESSEANLITLAQGRPCTLHLNIERIASADVPRDEEELGRWLFARWERKEQLLDSFAAKGHFGGDGAPAELGVRPEARRSALAAVLWWLTCVLAFVRWCLLHGRFRLLGVSAATSLIVLALFGFALQQVHLKKDVGAAKKTD